MTRQRVLWILLGVGAGVLVPSTSAAASTWTVCPSGCAFTQLAPALAQARDGDTISVGAGTFMGGVTVAHSVRIVGAGAKSTVISGGGPVMTIGVNGATTEPTVSLSGLTLTGGVATSSPVCGPNCGAPNYVTATALGGGLFIPPGANGTGATVTVTDSVISGNRATPTTTVPSARATCPGEVPCAFASGGGGGIATWGVTTLSGTAVTGNVVSGSISDADGGGVLVMAGGLTLLRSAVDGNAAIAAPPVGRFAEGGGIFVGNGVSLTTRNSSVSGNRVVLTSAFAHPYPKQSGDSDQSQANGGGIHAGDDGQTTIRNSRLDGNTIDVTDVNGEPVGFDAGLCTCGENTLVVANSSISNNRVTVTVGSQADSGPSGPSAFEIDGPATVSNSRIVGNVTTVTSAAGAAQALGAIGGFQASPDTATISDSRISDNTVTATSGTGSVLVKGAGLTNDGVMLLLRDRISRNTGTATGPTGDAQGGGIFNGVVFGQPPVTLTLRQTQVRGNALRGSAGVKLAGGGLYTVGFTPVLDRSHVRHNTPDDCVGC